MPAFCYPVFTTTWNKIFCGYSHLKKKLFLRVNGHIRCVSLRTHLLLLVLLLFYILLSARRACVLVVHDRRCCTRHCGRCKENIWEESHSYSYHHSNASLVLLLCGFHGNLPNRSLFQEDNLFYDPSAHMLRRVLFSWLEGERSMTKLDEFV